MSSDHRHINDAGLALVKRFEGLKLKAYRCPAGVWTIGYGHTRGVKAGDVCTREQAEAWLRADLEEAERDVLRLVKSPLSDNQFSALVSWTFNLGGGSLARSALLRRLNLGYYDAVPGEMKRWNKAGGHVLPGLVLRRDAEAKLWAS